LILLVINLH